MTQNVRLQNLRDFTVQILHTETEAIIGTGIAVSMDGQILTCAHVVSDAGVDPRVVNGKEVGIYFQFARGAEEKKRRAVIEKFFPEYDDDIVQLKLTDGSSPLAPEQMPILGSAQASIGHSFRSFGYRKLSSYQGLPADGHIVDYGAKPGDRNLLLEPLMLSSQHIDSGMSGAAVLDVERNLVVGLVYETYDSADWQKDRDTAFAVDSQVLKFKPFDFHLEAEPYPKSEAPEPKTDIAQAKAAVFIKEKYSWNSAPSVLTEWTGRDHLLAQLTADWNDPSKHVTGLIGFGGEGKSSLARKWVDTLLTGDSLPIFSEKKGEGPGMGVDGVFWWGFYENRSVDEFLEAALKYMSGGRIEPRQVQSSNLRAQIIGAMLGAGRYLFVLDGLEVMQHQEGDQYGLLQSNDLRDLLTFFARPDNQSFCLITSRAPLLDLMDYTTYTHRDVDRLSEEDGRALLRRLGVKGSEDEMNKVVADWDGHALTLSILAAYLAERYQGDIKHLADIPVPTADEPRYERVHRVLRRYDEHLTLEEREFLKLFSVFRLPVQESAFEKVFEPLLSKSTAKNAKDAKKESGFLRALSELRGSKKPILDSRISNIVNRLVTYRLIRHDEHEKSYTTHPLIRNHYFALFTKDPSTGSGQVLPQVKAAHEQIKDYYLSIAGDTPQYPTLDNLKPLIEVVHHACQAGAYDGGWKIYLERISQQNQFVIFHQLGAYDTALYILTGFFTSNDISKEPQVTEINDKRLTLAHIGLCLKNLGRLREAIQVYERKNELYERTSTGFQNLAQLHAQLGELDASAEAARQALDLARRAENKTEEKDTLGTFLGWAYYLQGDLQKASSSFLQAEKLAKEIYPQVEYLYSTRGIFYADYLRRAKQSDYARRVTDANLQICESNHFAYTPGMCHRVLGDLDADAGNPEIALIHYDTALKRARSESKRDALIEILLARGRFFAKHMKDANAAFSNLNEALGYCVEGGYRIYETDVRVALAWAYLASSEKEKAKQSAERAKQMSNEIGYHWGKVDAEEVLERIEDRE